MNTMNDTKKPRNVVAPPPKKYQWTEVPIKNKEGVVVKRPLEEEPLVIEDKEEVEVEEVVIEADEVIEDGVVIGEESKDGI